MQWLTDAIKSIINNSLSEPNTKKKLDLGSLNDAYHLLDTKLNNEKSFLFLIRFASDFQSRFLSGEYKKVKPEGIPAEIQKLLGQSVQFISRQFRDRSLNRLNAQVSASTISNTPETILSLFNLMANDKTVITQLRVVVNDVIKVNQGTLKSKKDRQNEVQTARKTATGQAVITLEAENIALARQVTELTTYIVHLKNIEQRINLFKAKIADTLSQSQPESGWKRSIARPTTTSAASVASTLFGSTSRASKAESAKRSKTNTSDDTDTPKKQ